MVKIDTLRQEVVASLLPLQPRRILLFGSYATNRATEESDIDLCLVTSEEASPEAVEVEAYRRIRPLMRRYGTPFDILVLDERAWRDRADWFVRQALGEEAVVLYEKP
jgi:predicted nucleotidyltransferase